MTRLARLAFTGDVVLSRAFPAQLDPAVARAFALLAEADLAFGDLEMPLTDRGVRQDKLITFGSSPELAESVPRMGYGVLSLATNHAMDQGPVGLQDTIAALAAVGVDTVGAGADLAAAERLLVREVGGMRVGFLAWTSLLPNGCSAGKARAGLAPLRVRTWYEVDASLAMEEPGYPPAVRTEAEYGDLFHVCEVVAAARARVDVLVVSMHWGYGATTQLADYQPQVGRALVEAGADLVVGAHVHSVQAVERHGRAVIAYSLANFVAQQQRNQLSEKANAILDEMTAQALIMLADIYDDGRIDVRFAPVMGGPDGLPRLAEGEAQERICAWVAQLSPGVEVSRDAAGFLVV